MLSRELADSLTLVLSERLLQGHQLSVTESLRLLALPSAAILACVASFTEWPRMARTGYYMTLVEHPLPFVGIAVSASGVYALKLGVVQCMSSLTYKFISITRSTGSVLLGILVYHEECSTQE